MKHVTAAYFDQDKKFKELKQEQENKINTLMEELMESKQEKEVQRKEQNQKLQETKEELERQIELFKTELFELRKENKVQKEKQDQIIKETKEALKSQIELFRTELHEIKKEKEVLKEEQDQIIKETKEVLESQIELFKTELHQMKEIQKEKHDQKLKETKETLENQIELFKIELHQLKQEKETQKKEHCQNLKEIKGVLENEIKLLKQDLNQSKQEMETLIDNTKQVEKQSRCIEQTEQNLLLEAIFPLKTFIYSDKFSTASALLSFVSKNETAKVLDNLLEFLKQEFTSDCQVMKDAWTYRKDDSMNFIWLLANYKVRQEEQKKDTSADIKSPFFSTGEMGYFFRVRFDPYGFKESRGNHLSCVLEYKLGQYHDSIKFPHQQEFRVTVVNLRDRQNDVSSEKNFQMSWHGRYCIVDESYSHKILSLTNAEKFLLNDVLILKASVKHYSI